MQCYFDFPKILLTLATGYIWIIKLPPSIIVMHAPSPVLLEYWQQPRIWFQNDINEQMLTSVVVSFI